MLRALAVLALLAGAALPSPSPAQRPTAEETQVLGVVQGLFDAMRARDPEALKALFAPGARLVGMRQRPGQPPHLQELTAEQFADLVARDPRAAWTERMWNPEVRVRGSLATVWAVYDFHFGETFSHCGVDAVQLLRLAEGWRIVSLADTYETEGCPRRPAGDSPGERVLREVHRRYSATRFRTLSFVQRTTFPDGRIEWWYEAESIPGRARVDVAPFEDGNASIFRADSAYLFRGGELARTGQGLAMTMWTLMDMYAVPPEETAAALRKRGVDLDRVHERDWNGRPVVVIGALEGDTLSPQVWLDREHLYNVRLVTRVPAGRQVIDIGKHTFQDGGWVEREIAVSLNGRRTLFEEYFDVRTNVELPADFFEPDRYRRPHWRVTHPYPGADPPAR